MLFRSGVAGPSPYSTGGGGAVPVYVLAKAIGHVPAPPEPPAPGFEHVEHVALTEQHADCSDPEDEEYWKDCDEVRRIAAERIAAHARKLTS